MLDGGIQTTWSRGPKVVVDCSGDVVRTKQSFRKEADINFIVARSLKTGMLVDPRVVAKREAIFGDFTQVGDFQDAQLRIVKGREAFESLSSSIRARFQNEPGLLLDFMADEANREEAQELGIIPKDDTVPAEPVEPPGPVVAAVPPVVAPVAPVLEPAKA